VLAEVACGLLALASDTTTAVRKKAGQAWHMTAPKPRRGEQLLQGAVKAGVSYAGQLITNTALPV